MTSWIHHIHRGRRWYHAPISVTSSHLYRWHTAVCSLHAQWRSSYAAAASKLYPWRPWMVHLIHYGRCPFCINDTVQLVADHASRTGLRSASTSLYITPRLSTIFEERTFSFSGPKTWNLLPGQFHLNNKHSVYSVTCFHNCVLSCLSKRRWDIVFVIGAIKIIYLLIYVLVTRILRARWHATNSKDNNTSHLFSIYLNALPLQDQIPHN